MADQTIRVDEDEADDARPVHPVSDPITGTRPAGPIGTSAPGEHRSGDWGTAARWIVFALLAIAFFLVLAWAF
jgi:hypothetical protein